MLPTPLAPAVRRTIMALVCGVFLVAGPLVRAEPAGIAAIATDATLSGKGSFRINDELNPGDTISTGEKGAVTILFNDESMLTLGPNSSARLDIYKESPAPGESRLTILSGQFRYFPGTILEKGGKQVVDNRGGNVLGGIDDNTPGGGSSGDLLQQSTLNNPELNEINNQLTDINTTLLGDLNASDLVGATPGDVTGGGGLGGGIGGGSGGE